MSAFLSGFGTTFAVTFVVLAAVYAADRWWQRRHTLPDRPAPPTSSPQRQRSSGRSGAYPDELAP